jgi:hypothetical protein
MRSNQPGQRKTNQGRNHSLRNEVPVLNTERIETAQVTQILERQVLSVSSGSKKMSGGNRLNDTSTFNDDPRNYEESKVE